MKITLHFTIYRALEQLLENNCMYARQITRHVYRIVLYPLWKFIPIESVSHFSLSFFYATYPSFIFNKKKERERKSRRIDSLNNSAQLSKKKIYLYSPKYSDTPVRTPPSPFGRTTPSRPLDLSLPGDAKRSRFFHRGKRRRTASGRGREGRASEVLGLPSSSSSTTRSFLPAVSAQTHR